MRVEDGASLTLSSSEYTVAYIPSCCGRSGAGEAMIVDTQIDDRNAAEKGEHEHVALLPKARDLLAKAPT